MNAEWIAQFDGALALANQAMDEEIAEFHAQHGSDPLSDLEDVLRDEHLAQWYSVVKAFVILRERLPAQKH
jgi:hypothetical protein